MTLEKRSVLWIVLIGLNITFGIGLIYFSNTHAPSIIDNQFTSLQSQLASLQQTIKAPTDNKDMAALHDALSELTRLINELNTKDANTIQQLMSNNQEALTTKLDTLETAVKSLDQKQHPITYLAAKALPFKVMSIDSLQNISVASVAYDYKTIPLEKNDALAGWTVLSVDFGTQKITFENAAKERVVIALEGEESHA